MAKKPADRRPDEKPTKPGGGTHPPDREPGRMPEDLEGRKGFEKSEGRPPEGRPMDKPFPAPGSGGTRKDAFDGGERSDRESGRPVQLEDDDEEERSDRESGRPVQLEDDDEEERSDRESGRPVQLQDDEEERSDRESGRPVELDEGRFQQRSAR